MDNLGYITYPANPATVGSPAAITDSIKAGCIICRRILLSILLSLYDTSLVVQWKGGKYSLKRLRVEVTTFCGDCRLGLVKKGFLLFWLFEKPLLSKKVREKVKKK